MDAGTGFGNGLPPRVHRVSVTAAVGRAGVVVGTAATILVEVVRSGVVRENISGGGGGGRRSTGDGAVEVHLGPIRRVDLADDLRLPVNGKAGKKKEEEMGLGQGSNIRLPLEWTFVRSRLFLS